jgi:hypothetical protein
VIGSAASPAMQSTSLIVGSRIRFRPDLLEPSSPLRDEEGTILRNDARGVLVRLDNGRSTLCQPEDLVVVLPSRP